MGSNIDKVGGPSVENQDEEKKQKLLVAKVIEINFLSGIDVYEKKKKVKPPHWKFRRKKVKPACFTRKSGGGKKNLEVTIEISRLENISGNAILIGEGSNIKIKSNPFSLKKGKSNPIKCEFEDLPDALYYFNKSALSWKIKHGSDFYSLINITPVILFIIFNNPRKPWSKTGSKSIWVEALKFVFTKVGLNNLKSKKSANAAITKYLHSSYGLTYDTKRGAPRYGVWANGNGKFKLTNYLKKTETTVNCYDQAAAVKVLSAVVGIGVKYQFMNPFGYINPTNLIGVGLCNNPFYNNPIYTNKKITSVNDPNRSSFGNHAFVKYHGKINDACAGPDLGSRTPKQYIKHSIDHSPSVKCAAGTESDIIPGKNFGVT